MEFEWDPEKSESNRLKHGIDFVDAMQLWKGRTIRRETYRGNDPERTRWIGMIGGRYWTAVTTQRDGRVRIISVRRSRSSEKELYDVSNQA